MFEDGGAGVCGTSTGTSIQPTVHRSSSATLVLERELPDVAALSEMWVDVDGSRNCAYDHCDEKYLCRYPESGENADCRLL